MLSNEETVLRTTNCIQIPPVDDRDLVAAAQRGEERAFAALMDRYHRMILAIVRRVSGSYDDGEDLAQQTFMKAFAHIDKFAGRSSFSTWLMSIALNESLMWRRKAWRTREIPLATSISREGDPVAFECPDTGPDPAALYLRKEWSSRLRSAMNYLAPVTRATLQLCDLEERSMDEVALFLGISVSAVKSRRSRGRATLRQKLGRRPTRKASLCHSGQDYLSANLSG
jgi:RNA polymerase sigma-70 factor, ECF subfamily